MYNHPESVNTAEIYWYCVLFVLSRFMSSPVAWSQIKISHPFENLTFFHHSDLLYKNLRLKIYWSFLCIFRKLQQIDLAINKGDTSGTKGIKIAHKLFKMAQFSLGLYTAPMAFAQLIGLETSFIDKIYRLEVKITSDG